MINGLSIESTVLMKRRFLFFCFAEIASNATYMVSIKTGIVCRQWPNYPAATTSVSENTPLLHKYRCTTELQFDWFGFGQTSKSVVVCGPRPKT